MVFATTTEFMKPKEGNSQVITHEVSTALTMAETIAPGERWRLRSIALHLDTAGGVASENFTAQIDADAGVAFDILIVSQDMNTTTDVLFIPDQILQFTAEDQIDFAWANANTRTWGLTVVIEIQS